MNKITLPDLRFEETFMKSLYGYSGQSKVHSKPTSHSHLSDEELELLNKELDRQEQEMIEQPLITPGTVVYAIIKDQIIMPLIQGFLWTGFLISMAPVMRIIVRQGQIAGKRLYDLMGLGNLRRGVGNQYSGGVRPAY